VPIVTKIIFKPIKNLKSTVSSTLKTWHERSTYRSVLARLDSRLLADAGISESTRYHELSKPFWRK